MDDILIFNHLLYIISDKIYLLILVNLCLVQIKIQANIDSTYTLEYIEEKNLRKKYMYFLYSYLLYLNFHSLLLVYFL